jgi:hypothetical protein
LNKIREFLAGKKTYLIAIATIVGGLIAFADGKADVMQTLQLIATAIIGATLRAGIAKSNPN